MEVVKQFGTITETEAIKRVLAGETELFEILVRRNNPFLYKTGRSYGYNHEDTEDLMQEAFIAAYQSLASFEHRSSFKTWITRIMLNGCYHKSRKLSFKNEKTTDTIIHEKEIPMFVNDEINEPDKAFVNKELSQIIGNALTRIPVDYRMVFSLRELSGLNTNETAEVLDISAVNVKVRLNRARHMLRTVIEKMYSPEDVFEFNLIYCDKIVHHVMKAINKS
ncbi:MAG TPA: sigma-70 family RNA polymerase sigma factor [Chitinophagaceae bacterium]